MSDFYLFQKKGDKAWPNASSLRDEHMTLKKSWFDQFSCLLLFENSDAGDLIIFEKQTNKACLNAPVWQFMQIFEKLYCTKKKKKIEWKMELKHIWKVLENTK